MQKKRGSREVLVDNLRARMKADLAIANQPLLAARSGVDQGYISRVLRGEAAPTVDTLDKLATACRCQTWELLIDGDAAREEAVRRFLGRI